MKQFEKMSHHKCRRHSCCKGHSHRRKKSSDFQFQPFYVIDPAYQNGAAVRLVHQNFLQKQSLPLTNLQNGSVAPRNLPFPNGTNQFGYGPGLVQWNMVPAPGVPFSAEDVQRVNYASNENYSPTISRKTADSTLLEHDGVAVQTIQPNFQGDGIKALGIPVCFLGTNNKVLNVLNGFQNPNHIKTHKDSTYQHSLERHGGNYPKHLKKRFHSRRTSSKNRRFFHDRNLSNRFEMTPKRDYFLSTGYENYSMSSEGSRNFAEERNYPYERRSTEAFQMRRIKSPSAPARYMYRKSKDDTEGEYVFVPTRNSYGYASENNNTPVEAPVRDVEPEQARNESGKWYLNDDLPKIRDELHKHSLETQKRIDSLEQKIEELKACICPPKSSFYGYDNYQRSTIKNTQTESNSIPVEHIALIPADQFKPCKCNDARRISEDEEDLLDRHSHLKSSRSLLREKIKSKMSIKPKYSPKKVCCVSPPDDESNYLDDCTEIIECPRKVCQCGNTENGDDSSTSIFFARTDESLIPLFAGNYFEHFNIFRDEKTTRFDSYKNYARKECFPNIFESFRMPSSTDFIELITKGISFPLDFFQNFSEHKSSISSQCNAQNFSNFTKILSKSSKDLNGRQLHIPLLNLETKLLDFFDLNKKIRIYRKNILIKDIYEISNSFRKFNSFQEKRYLFEFSNFKTPYRNSQRKNKRIFKYFKQNPLRKLVKGNHTGIKRDLKQLEESNSMKFTRLGFLTDVGFLQKFCTFVPSDVNKMERQIFPCYCCCPTQKKDAQTAASPMQQEGVDPNDCRVLEETHVVRCEKFTSNNKRKNRLNQTEENTFMSDADETTNLNHGYFMTQTSPNKIFLNPETLNRFPTTHRAPRGEYGGYQLPSSTNTFVYLSPHNQGVTQNENTQTNPTTMFSRESSSGFSYETVNRNNNQNNGQAICRGGVCSVSPKARHLKAECKCPYIQECRCPSSNEQIVYCKCPSTESQPSRDAPKAREQASAPLPNPASLCSDDQKCMYIEKRECNDVSRWICRPVGHSFCNTDRSGERDISTHTEPRFMNDQPIQTVDERCNEKQQTCGNVCFLRCEVCEKLHQLSTFDKNFQIICKNCTNEVAHCIQDSKDKKHESKDVQTTNKDGSWKCEDCKKDYSKEDNEWLCKKCRSTETKHFEEEYKPVMKCFECKQSNGTWTCKTCEEMRNETDTDPSDRYVYEEEIVETGPRRNSLFVKGKSAQQEEDYLPVRVSRRSTRKSTKPRFTKSRKSNAYAVNVLTQEEKNPFIISSGEHIYYNKNEERRYPQEINKNRREPSNCTERLAREDVYNGADSGDEIDMAVNGQSFHNDYHRNNAFYTNSRSTDKERRPESRVKNVLSKEINIIKSCFSRRPKKTSPDNAFIENQPKIPYKRTHIADEEDSDCFSKGNYVLDRIVQNVEAPTQSPFKHEAKKIYRSKENETVPRTRVHQNITRPHGMVYSKKDSPSPKKIKKTTKRQIMSNEDSDGLVDPNDSSIEVNGMTSISNIKKHGQYCLKRLKIKNQRKSIYVLAKRKNAN